MACKSFFVTKKLPEHFFASIIPKYRMDMWQHSHDISRTQLLESVKGKEGIVCSLTDKIDAQLLDSAGPQLKTISTISAGYDHIDIDECRKRGITVGHTPNVLTDAVAELTIALLLATIRRFTEATDTLRRGKWEKGWKHFSMCGSMVKNSVIGVIGAGHIGQGVMKRLKAFEPAQMLYNTRNVVPKLETEMGAHHVPLNQLLKDSDIVIICCSLNASTKHLIGHEQLKLMKNTSILINTSRGAVIDQTALYEALKSGTIGSAGLDVFETEPIATDDPLLKLDNVVLLPHIGSAVLSTRQQMIHFALENLVAGLEGRTLRANAIAPK